MTDGVVTVKISPDGSKVESDAEGFVGKQCEELMAPILKALGTVEEKKYKPEYYKTESGGVKIGH
jgi:hypothetical protein